MRFTAQLKFADLLINFYNFEITILKYIGKLKNIRVNKQEINVIYIL
jgi:hypothetical protein